MDQFEFEGKTTEEAIQNASRELNIPVEDLNVDILEPGSAGIFGLVGNKKAKIRVQIDSGPVEEDEPEPAQKTEPQAAPDAHVVNLAKETLQKILDLIPIDAGVRVTQVEGNPVLNIEGDKSGLLIGRKGKTLDAIQYLLNKILNKALDQKTNILVDSENYRQRRDETLTQMALKMGEKALRSRRPVTTNPLNPHDRRIVHLTLREDKRLDTKSRGDGLLKKVLIIPRR
ncbi:MAG: protein jag [Desulfobacteraceae bacterium]|nr:MAG: protein jag [Desulfobacteraceae bacterium]